MHKPIKFTDESVRALRLVGRGERPAQYEVRDTELPGFFVRVGRKSRVYCVSTEVRSGEMRRALKRTLGDARSMQARDARKEAQRKIVELQKEHARPAVEIGPTLRQAYEDYKRLNLEPKNASKHTFDDYRLTCEVHLKDWLDIPLRTLSENPRMMVERHVEISKKGKFTANHVARNLRAIYNHARTLCRALPVEHPSIAVKLHREHTAKTAMLSDAMPEWWRQLQENVHSPVRREFHLMTLLSGSRPTALCNIEREHIRLQDRALFLRLVKGGVMRAFWVPLSDAMIASIERTIQAGEMLYPTLAKRWLYPAESDSGHVTEWKEDRHVLSKWGKDLRQTFDTMAYKAEVPEPFIQLLMNHRLTREGKEVGAEKNVTQGYRNVYGLTPEMRAAQEKISAYIMSALHGTPDERTS